MTVAVKVTITEQQALLLSELLKQHMKLTNNITQDFLFLLGSLDPKAEF